MKTKLFRLVFPLEGVLPAGVIDLTDKQDDHWQRGHVYQAPAEYIINPEYIDELNKKDLVK